MIDIRSFNKVLEWTLSKKKWYLDDDNHGKWKLFFDSEIHDFGGVVIFKGNLDKNDLATFIMVTELSGVQFGLKSYMWFHLKSHVWFQNEMVWCKVQLPLY